MNGDVASSTPAEAGRAARTCHPSRHWRPDRARMRARMAEVLGAQGTPRPELVAAVLSLRGRLGLDQRDLARHLGVAVDVISALEQGRLPPARAPARALRDALPAIAPDIDWAGLGLGPS